ncbi:MAG TPA: hypothetical protein VLA50_09050, partial [Erythrobacter sp.]|nr:hypothetical protein [Erythrobacter sp.]
VSNGSNAGQVYHMSGRMGLEVRQLTKADGTEQIVICRRKDGTYTYQRRWKDGAQWGPPGPECGVYDSAMTAETEAMQWVAWLADVRH